MAKRPPSIASQHADWLRLIEVSGPFLSLPVLVQAFGHGLDKVESEAMRRIRTGYAEWKEGAKSDAADRVWIETVITGLLEHEPASLAPFDDASKVPVKLRHRVEEHAEVLAPQIVIKEADRTLPEGARVLVCTYARSQRLDRAVTGSRWSASPQSRMAELCRATGVRLGVVTNGEQWTLVDAPKDETIGYATWYAQLWLDEPGTLSAFRSLLGRHRLFAVGQDETLESLLTKSRENQHEVTTQLGLQVRRAVEVLVRALDRADQDSKRALLQHVGVTEIYQAAVTVMMRLVFLLSAEERGLLLLGDPLFDQYYAVSTLCEQLRETADQHGEELLERRSDAWCRLLAAFRAVHGGVQHDRLQIRAYGGGLFDPDRYPFLEGRSKGTTWREAPSDPLPIDNRTLLHILESLQFLQVKLGGHVESRRLSFRALGIEQIGHVYEGLLDHTAIRARDLTLGLVGPDGSESEVLLSALEEKRGRGEAELIDFLHEHRVKSGKPAIKKLIAAELPAVRLARMERLCRDQALWKRVEPFAPLLRDDDFGQPLILLPGQLYATAGQDRSDTGTQYTPVSLTQPVVEYSLEPLVYIGPAEGTPREQWRLRTPKEILDLKVCDMACGSGAFLVQACRYLADRLIEAWTVAEKAAPSPNPGKIAFPTITFDGSPGRDERDLVPRDPDDRLLVARRLIAQRCLFGVDINPVAAEMAKLSIWLLTLSKDKPFSFLDHAIRSGDALLGLNDLDQLKHFSLDTSGTVQYTFDKMPLTELIEKASGTRLQIEQINSANIGHVQVQARLLGEADKQTERLKYAADMLISGYLQPARNAGERIDAINDAAVKAGQLALGGTPEDFRAFAQHALSGKRPFHWCLEFPEIIGARGGFDAIIGNPPFYAGAWLESLVGSTYRKHLVEHLAKGRTGLRGTADLCGYFLLRSAMLVRRGGHIGLVATSAITDGDTQAVALSSFSTTVDVYRVLSDRPWPGNAAVRITVLWAAARPWHGSLFIDGLPVNRITSRLTNHAIDEAAEPLALAANAPLICKGHELQGDGFKVSEDEARRLIAADSANSNYLAPLITGDDINNVPGCLPSCWAINLRDMSLEEAGRHPALLAIVESRVKPERLQYTGTTSRDRYLRDKWWLYRGFRKEIEAFSRRHSSVIARSVVSKHNAWCLLPSRFIVTAATTVILDDRPSTFGVLQSSVHEAWARRFASSLGGTSRYIAGRCFVPFPMPTHAETLDGTSAALHELRTQLSLARRCGLTDLYNSLAVQTPSDKELGTLRGLHESLDKEVLEAYGWSDIAPEYSNASRDESVRFGFSPSVEIEVLARLLALNHQRYAEEVAAGLHDTGKPMPKPNKAVRTAPASADKTQLF